MRDKIESALASPEPRVSDELLLLLTRCQAGDISTAGPAMIHVKIRYHQGGGGEESLSCLTHISSEDKWVLYQEENVKKMFSVSTFEKREKWPVWLNQFDFKRGRH